MKVTHLTATLLLCVFFFGPDFAEASARYSFAGNRAEVQMPEDFIASLDGRGGLSARFGPDGANHVELVLQDRKGAARQLRAYAERRKLPLRVEAGKVILIEPGTDFVRAGVTYRRAYWRIAFGSSLVVLTLTAPLGDGVSPELSHFFRVTLDDMIFSLRRL